MTMSYWWIDTSEDNAPVDIFYRKLFLFDMILYAENEKMKFFFNYKYTMSQQQFQN